MDAKNTSETLSDEILRWVNETRAILTSIKRIVEYFGTDEEYESLLAALRYPEEFFEGVLPAFRDPTWRLEGACAARHAFKCERSIAEKITPLLQLIVEPVPDLVPWAREELDKAHYSALSRNVNPFLGHMSLDICEPIWRSFPDLAPEGWPLKPDSSSTD